MEISCTSGNIFSSGMPTCESDLGFPVGLLWIHDGTRTIGDGKDQLLPGIYVYRAHSGGDRVDGQHCSISTYDEIPDNDIEMPYGKPFQATFYTYHVSIRMNCYGGTLYRVGD